MDLEEHKMTNNQKKFFENLLKIQDELFDLSRRSEEEPELAKEFFCTRIRKLSKAFQETLKKGAE